MIRISFDGSAVDLLPGENGLLPKYAQSRSQNISGSGARETINFYGDQVLALDFYMTPAAYRKMTAWWSWARQGNLFSLAYDSTRTASTTLASGHGAGSTGLDLASDSGINVGDELFICNTAADNQFEIVQVDGTGSPLPLTDATLLTYPAGSLVRHADYYPSLICLDEKFEPKPVGENWLHTLTAVVQ
jgi:hypothetical protein